jgi:hypothetical protein
MANGGRCFGLCKNSSAFFAATSPFSAQSRLLIFSTLVGRIDCLKLVMAATNSLNRRLGTGGLNAVASMVAPLKVRLKFNFEDNPYILMSSLAEQPSNLISKYSGARARKSSHERDLSG